MTGRVICAALIAALIAGICTVSFLYTERFSKDIKDRIDKVYSDEKDTDRKIEKIKEIWEKYSDRAAFYIEHDELENVTLLIERIEETAEESEQIFKMDCKEIELIMEHLRESQMPKLNNIF